MMGVDLDAFETGQRVPEIEDDKFWPQEPFDVRVEDARNYCRDVIHFARIGGGVDPVAVTLAQIILKRLRAPTNETGRTH
jgi:hypothetical protein